MGVVSQQIRIAQTLETFSSITAVFPDSQIHYVDAGAFSTESSAALVNLRGFVSNIIDLRTTAYVKTKLNEFDACPSGKLMGLTKSLLEARSYLEFFNETKNQLGGSSVVKLSARYRMTAGAHRNTIRWLQSGLDFMAGQPKRTYLKNGNLDFTHYRRTVLWGVRSDAIPKFQLINEQLITLLESELAEGRSFDLEHGFQHLLESESVYTLRGLHVTGQVASFGKLIRL